MKIATDALRAAIKTCAPAVLIHPQLPHLGCVRLDVDAEGITFSATDHQTWITTSVPVEADLGVTPVQPATALVSHRLLNQVAGVIRAGDAELDIDPDGRAVKVTAGKSDWSCPTMLGETLAAPETPKKLGALDHADLAAAVASVAVAAHGEPSLSPPMHVVEVHADATGALRLTATDRHRMHSLDIAAGARRKGSFYPEASSLAKIVGSLSGKVTISADGDLFALADERTTIVTRAIGVDKWAQVESMLTAWRDGVTATTLVAAPVLADAIRAAQVALPDDSIGVRFDIDAETFTVTAADPNSSATARVDIEEHQHDGPGLVAMLRSSLVLPVLALAGDLEVSIEWTKPTGAVLFGVAGQPGTYVVMALSVPDQGIGWKDGA